MRKKLAAFFVILLCFGCSLLSSCGMQGDVLQNEDKNITEISVDPSTVPDEIVVGKLDEADIMLKIKYSDGSEDSIPITSNLISAEYRQCLEKPGVYTVDILYRNKIASVTLNIVSYEVKYYAKNADNETVLVSTQKVNSLDALVAPVVQEEIWTEAMRYTFREWSTPAYENGAVISIYALYDEDVLYTVNFYNGNEALIETQTVVAGADATPPDASARAMEGYTFLGWDRSYRGVSKNLDIYGVYYRFSSDINGFITYTATNEAGYTYKYMHLGKYPQTVVSDEDLIGALADAVDSDNDGYIEYLGEEYAAITAIANETNSASSFRNGSYMENGAVYYFKVEPIRWRVYESGDGHYELISEYILDTQQINLQEKENGGYYFSEMRTFLNSTFYDKAFSAEEKMFIVKTIVDNSTESGNCIENESSEDFVYLLSYNDLMNNMYGFVEDDQRIALNTDYTMARGAYTNGYYNNSGDWWLRTIAVSGYEEWDDQYYCVFSDNRVECHNEDGQADTNTYGIRPVIRINMN